MKSKFALLSIFVLLLTFFALPALAQDVEGTSEATEVPEVPIEVVVDAPAPVEDNSDWFLDLLTLLGEAFNSYPGGFLSAASILIFLQRFSNNSQVIAVLEKQFENSTNTFPPQTIELLRDNANKFGDALAALGKALKEVTDGIPIESKNQSSAASAEKG